MPSPRDTANLWTLLAAAATAVGVAAAAWSASRNPGTALAERIAVLEVQVEELQKERNAA